MIANSERAGLNDSADDRFIEERPSVRYRRHNRGIGFVHFTVTIPGRVAVAFYSTNETRHVELYLC
jgi:hypothetical protein